MTDLNPTALDDGVIFSAVLEPHRSANRRVVRNIAIALTVVFVPVGIGFTLIGAWPVLGFMGLEVFALIALLGWHQSSGCAIETIALTPSSLHIERREPWGRKRTWSFAPHWLQVNIDQAGRIENRLELRSHGRAVVVGNFLTPDERLSLAAALRENLTTLTRADFATAHG